MPKYKLPLWIGAILALCTFIYLVVQKNRKSLPLVEHAKEMSRAIDERRPQAVLGYSFSSEKRLLNLNASNIEHLLRLYDKSKQRNVQWKAWSFQTSDKDQILVADSIGQSKNSPLAIGTTFTLHRTNEGVSCFVIPVLVFGICRNLYSNEYDQYPERDRMALATVRGLNRLKVDLNNLGITGTLDEHRLDRVVTWDDWIKFWSKQLARKNVVIK